MRDNKIEKHEVKSGELEKSEVREKSRKKQFDMKLLKN